MLDRSNVSHRRTVRWLVAACAAGAVGTVAAREATPAVPSYTKPRPGLYGRIDVRGTTPPLIYPQPVVATPSEGGTAHPVYLYVPPGQVRKWAQHCAKWQACERPVYFVRVDDSPSRLGQWKKTQRPQPADSPVLQALNRFAS